MYKEDSDKHCEFRLQLQKLGFTTHALTLKKSQHLLSSESDLLTRI